MHTFSLSRCFGVSGELKTSEGVVDKNNKKRVDDVEEQGIGIGCGQDIAKPQSFTRGKMLMSTEDERGYWANVDAWYGRLISQKKFSFFVFYRGEW